MAESEGFDYNDDSPSPEPLSQRGGVKQISIRVPAKEHRLISMAVQFFSEEGELNQWARNLMVKEARKMINPEQMTKMVEDMVEENDE